MKTRLNSAERAALARKRAFIKDGCTTFCCALSVYAVLYTTYGLTVGWW